MDRFIRGRPCLRDIPSYRGYAGGLFITLRTALNFADHGELSFNLGENYSGATSYLYPLWIALIRKAAGDFIIPAILIVNSLAVLGAGYLFANFISLLLDSCKANVTFLN